MHRFTRFLPDLIIRESDRNTLICMTQKEQNSTDTDDEAVEAFEYLSRIEGIIPAIESSHALAYARKLAPQMDKDKIIVVNISGRGDKDVAAIARYRGIEIDE